jgi:hypothetical protein
VQEVQEPGKLEVQAEQDLSKQEEFTVVAPVRIFVGTQLFNGSG